VSRAPNELAGAVEGKRWPRYRAGVEFAPVEASQIE
jgi:hypothetical protein